MKTKNHKSLKVLVLVVIFTIAIVGGFFLVKFLTAKKDTTDNNSTNSQTTTVTNETQPTTQKTEEPEPPKKITQYAGEDPNKSETLTGNITYVSKNGNNLTVRVNIDQFLSSGSCEIKLLQNNSIAYQSSADIIANVSTSSCKGFDIPATSLSGNYEIIINLTSGDRTGTIKGEASL